MSPLTEIWGFKVAKLNNYFQKAGNVCKSELYGKSFGLGSSLRTRHPQGREPPFRGENQPLKTLEFFFTPLPSLSGNRMGFKNCDTPQGTYDKNHEFGHLGQPIDFYI